MKKIFVCFMLGIIASSFAGCKNIEPTKDTAPASSEVTATVSSEYNFEDGISLWKPFGETQVIQSTDNPHSGKASLKISGTGTAGRWIFASSDKISVTPGKRYKFSGWMLVESISQNSSAFKCVFRQGGKWLKNNAAKDYDMKKKGEWQESSVEFTVPEGNDISLNIIVEKRPRVQAVEATIYIDDLKLEQLN